MEIFIDAVNIEVNIKVVTYLKSLVPRASFAVWLGASCKLAASIKSFLAAAAAAAAAASVGQM